jgi:hypothetical protein
MVTDPHSQETNRMNTKQITKVLGGVALAATLALGGCADQATTPSLLDEALTLNAAIVAADATLEDLMLASVPFSFGAEAMGPGMGGMRKGQPGGHQGIGREVAGTRTRTFFDANGQEQEAYDSLTTASVHVVVDIGGDVSRGPWSGSLSRTRDMTVTGLLGAETTRTFNGSGSESVSRSRTLDDGSEASFDMDGTFTQSNVVVPVPGSEPRYPRSGTVTRTMKVSVVNGPQGDVTRDVTVVITYDGDNTATAVVNGETTEIDLDARPGGFPLKGRFGRKGG